MRASTLVASGIALAAAACGGPQVEPAPAPAAVADSVSRKDQWHATLVAHRQDSTSAQVAGSATMGPGAAAATTVVTVFIRNATPLRVHPWSVHRGSCDRDAGALDASAFYPPLQVARNGESESTSTLTLPTPTGGSYFVTVRSASTDMETEIACGDLRPPAP